MRSGICLGCKCTALLIEDYCEPCEPTCEVCRNAASQRKWLVDTEEVAMCSECSDAMLEAGDDDVSDG